MAARGLSQRLKLPTAVTVFYVAVAAPTIVLVIYAAASREWSLSDAKLLFWLAVIAVAEGLPIPAWGGTQVTVSFPLLMAVAFLYEPNLALIVTFFASLDPREWRREVTLWRALFNRSQVAIATMVGSVIFHALVGWDSSFARAGWPLLLAAGTVASAIAYLLNTLLVAIAVMLAHQMPLRTVLPQLPVGNVREFLFFYVGLGILGVPLARLYAELGSAREWVIALFLVPLFLARQMFARSKALQQVTEELQARERVLRQLSNRMAEERYDERRQIAGYLHDDLAQMLFRLGLHADMIRSKLQRGQQDAVLGELDRVEDIKNRSIKLVRGLIKDLDRSPLGRAGLPTALATLASELSRDGAVRVHVDVADVSMPPPVQLLTYQIAREAVQNAVKHGQPSNVWVTLDRSGQEVRLEVRDDGAGFDTNEPLPEGHFGLAIMRERAALAGGSLMVDSRPGGGTTVKFAIDRHWLEPRDGRPSRERDEAPASASER